MKSISLSTIRNAQQLFSYLSKNILNNWKQLEKIHNIMQQLLNRTSLNKLLLCVLEIFYQAANINSNAQDSVYPIFYQILKNTIQIPKIKYKILIQTIISLALQKFILNQQQMNQQCNEQINLYSIPANLKIILLLIRKAAQKDKQNGVETVSILFQFELNKIQLLLKIKEDQNNCKIKNQLQYQIYKLNYILLLLWEIDRNITLKYKYQTRINFIKLLNSQQKEIHKFKCIAIFCLLLIKGKQHNILLQQALIDYQSSGLNKYTLVENSTQYGIVLRKLFIDYAISCINRINQDVFQTSYNNTEIVLLKMCPYQAINLESILQNFIKLTYLYNDGEFLIPFKNNQNIQLKMDYGKNLSPLIKTKLQLVQLINQCMNVNQYSYSSQKFKQYQNRHKFQEVLSNICSIIKQQQSINKMKQQIQQENIIEQYLEQAIPLVIKSISKLNIKSQLIMNKIYYKNKIRKNHHNDSKGIDDVRKLLDKINQIEVKEQIWKQLYQLIQYLLKQNSMHIKLSQEILLRLFQIDYQNCKFRKQSLKISQNKNQQYTVISCVLFEHLNITHRTQLKQTSLFNLSMFQKQSLSILRLMCEKVDFNIIRNTLKKCISIMHNKVNQVIINCYLWKSSLFFIRCLQLCRYKIKVLTEELTKLRLSNDILEQIFCVDAVIVPSYMRYLITKQQNKFKSQLYDCDKLDLYDLINVDFIDLYLKSDINFKNK